MTDFTLNLVDAIISGKATDIETAFQEAITDKISVAMESKKLEVAQGMFKESVEELDEDADDWTHIATHTDSNGNKSVLRVNTKTGDAELSSQKGGYPPSSSTFVLFDEEGNGWREGSDSATKKFRATVKANHKDTKKLIKSLNVFAGKPGNTRWKAAAATNEELEQLDEI